MAHFQSDIIQPSGACEEKREQRLAQIRTWFGFFEERFEKALGFRPIFCEQAAESVNSSYWETVNGRAKPMMNKKDESKPVTIDRHKICSIMELTIVYLQPIKHENPIIRGQLNAELAYFVALNIICNWDMEKAQPGMVSDSFDREHTAWLEYINTEHVDDFPIFSNAATWYLIEELLLLKGAKSK